MGKGLEACHGRNDGKLHSDDGSKEECVFSSLVGS